MTQSSQSDPVSSFGQGLRDAAVGIAVGAMLRAVRAADDEAVKVELRKLSPDQLKDMAQLGATLIELVPVVGRELAAELEPKANGDRN